LKKKKENESDMDEDDEAIDDSEKKKMKKKAGGEDNTSGDDNNKKKQKKQDDAPTKSKKRKYPSSIPQREEYASVLDYLEAKYVQGVMIQVIIMMEAVVVVKVLRGKVAVMMTRMIVDLYIRQMMIS